MRMKQPKQLAPLPIIECAVHHVFTLDNGFASYRRRSDIRKTGEKIVKTQIEISYPAPYGTVLSFDNLKQALQFACRNQLRIFAYRWKRKRILGAAVSTPQAHETKGERTMKYTALAIVRGAGGLLLPGVIDCELHADPADSNGMPVLILARPNQAQYECDCPEFPALEGWYGRPMQPWDAARLGVEVRKYTGKEEPFPADRGTPEAKASAERALALAERFNHAIAAWRGK